VISGSTYRRLARVIASTLVAAAWVGLGSEALAGANDAQARQMLKQALEEDYLETRFDDAEQKLRGALQLCASGCADAVRAELHAALGAVLAGGKKELEDARDEFIEALKIDPKAQPDSGMLSTEVTFAFEQAKQKLGLGSAKPKPPDAPPPPPTKRKIRAPDPIVDDKDPKPEVKDPVEEKPVRKNWITLSFAPDLSVVGGTNVCSKETRETSNYVCIRKDVNETVYTGTPTRDNGNNINAGIALSTLRLMLAYDRVIIDNLTLGARVGFAFNGGAGDAKFLPVHLEGRIGYWPGKRPFAGSIVRPYIMLSGGLAQIDTKVNVEVLEDGNVCGADNPKNTSSPCTKKSPDGVLEKRVQTLSVYKQAGLGFGALSFGLHFAPTPAVALYLAVRANITFPVVTGVFSPEGGLALGF
jgi:hypothetical protein